ncbi:MAG: dolichyl-phosphate beta-D-mannosyltransferase, dolichol-phosphate mannosyltransferase [Candidatus Gottesmanbacteria bacterium GW2011_GWA2_43_14]|uniref:Dolichyl-phosphate beta-D-mannosyltransferase, dolichol-phosphate mannosyltransferase n=1 Tax=Candidatus Gottesmanbacteria bacterium GW2011_GWA2_43_14 TaxID=1618443 RepID=A0A0G1DM16_9BACT|nr:MAG: dolichyl-phosphate beta-D-mannosyltransferase, dolichol-phosphate mannosyltransferase [Candidatus Gottesmanbacteria bacterium GW2011_GWA2_43_14]
MKIAHIIPTFNERDNIKEMLDVLYDLSRKYPQWENIVIVVDDQSPDGTAEIVRKYTKDRLKVHLLSKKKEGLGRALILGYEFAVKKVKADLVIPNDADFQWDPRDYPKLVKKIEEGYDVAVASRHIPGGKVVGWNWFRKLNHEVSNSLLAWVLAGVHEVKDHAGNFKAIRVKGILDKVPLAKMKNAGFSFQLHILYELSKTTAKFIEVPVVFRERKFGQSKIGFNRYYLRDILEYIKSSLLIRYDRSQRFFKYGLVGLIGLAVQTLLSKILIISGMAPAVAVSIGAESAIITNYLLNNYWTFKSHVIEGGDMLKKFLQFNAASIGAVLIQGAVVWAGTGIFGESSWFIFMILSIVFLVIPYSYFVYNRFIWKTHQQKLYA